MPDIITVKNLVKLYDPDIRAVDDISFTVTQGEIFGFLGPNGAGKSTAIKVLTTLLRRTSGEVTIKGLDIEKDAREIRKIIGYASQEIGVDADLTGRENLILQCRYFHIPKDKAVQKANDLLRTVGLADVGDRLAGTYSGGMKRRLDLATALVSDPEILFLDEPTTGLDPQSRRAIWDHIRDLNRRGTTIFLTTQYMEEADQLAHRLCIIDNGRIVAEGEPGKLKGQISADIVHLIIRGGEDPDLVRKAHDIVSKLPGVKEVQERTEGGIKSTEGIVIYSVNGSNLVPLIVRALDIAHIEIENLELAKPSLDDVFIKFTGKQLRTDLQKLPPKAGFRSRRR
ncbi:MAG: ATP-binding cassette domain-containing protein [Methanomassiliicoccales archaeon]|nr:ATP-binding cassette domain-containing protein [Methanomassiliicoccales archaeon]